MKPVITAFFIMSCFIASYGQSSNPKFNYDNFEEQIIAYQSKNNNISEDAYNYALMVLKNTKEATKSNLSNFNCIDYYNICMAFLKLGESKEAISIAFKKAINEKDNNICFYLKRYGSPGLETIIPELYFEFYSKCNADSSDRPEIDLDNYALTHKLDAGLITVIQ